MSRQIQPISVGAGLAALFSLFMIAPAANAQGIQSAGDAPREGEEVRGDAGVAEIRQVERGVYVSVDIGPNHYLHLQQPGYVSIGRPLFEDLGRPTTWFSPGTRMGLRVGYDVLNNVNAEVFATANFNEGVIDGKRIADGQLTGDLTHFAAGVAGRFAFITTDRVFVFARAGVGYALWFPPALAQDAFGSIHVDGSLGVEYYTKLRHLSVGIEAGVQSLLLPFAFGVSLYPTVKYTF
jgi:hypothetical protein